MTRTQYINIRRLFDGREMAQIKSQWPTARQSLIFTDEKIAQPRIVIECTDHQRLLFEIAYANRLS